MKDLFIEIWGSIRRNKLRTCLTGFAVAWGIFMLIVLLGAGNGLMNSFMNDSGEVAVNTMMVGGGWTSKPYDGLQAGRSITLKDKDLQITQGPAFADHIDEVSPNLSISSTPNIRFNNRTTTVNISGVNPDHKNMDRIEMLEGRFINKLDIEQRRKSLVVSSATLKTCGLKREDYAGVIGQHLDIDSLAFQIVGVYKGRDNEWTASAYIPYSTVKAIYTKGQQIDNITFSFHGLDTEEANEQFEKDYRSTINTLHRAAPDDNRALWIWNRFTQNLQMNKATGMLRTALWIIGLLTLLSGIVGVSNIMLITVKERTHEFGIRKAIGAKPWSIMKLIMSESICITAFFGYVGMILGLVACEILNNTVGQTSMQLFDMEVQLLKDPFVGVDVALGATIVLIVAGTIAGIFPAAKAVKVKPIEALMAS